MTIARDLARYIVQTKFSDLPAEVIEHTKMCILDPDRSGPPSGSA